MASLKPSCGKSIESFKLAIEKDPEYAIAYVGLADAYNLLGLWIYEVFPPAATMEKARAAAEKALTVDASLAEAHTSLGFVKSFFEWDWAGAEREFKTALRLNSSYATAHHWYSLHLANLRLLDEAIVETRRALELDPLSAIINNNLAYLLYLSRRYPEAIEQCQKTLELEPNFPVTYVLLGCIDLQTGRIQESLARAEQATTFTRGRFMLALCLLGCAHARAGQTAEAKNIIEELKIRSKQEHVPSYVLAGIYTGLGDADEAIAWLQRAAQERSSMLPVAATEPIFESLKSDPRFEDLMQRLGM